MPSDVKYLPPVAGDLGTSVLDYRKRVVEKVELAQNLARENLRFCGYFVKVVCVKQ